MQNVHPMLIEVYDGCLSLSYAEKEKQPTSARSRKAAIAGCADDDTAVVAPDAVAEAPLVANPVDGPPSK